VIQPPTPESIKFNIFERVNRGGVNLNKQEMRHALYQGKATRLIQELAQSPQFQQATGNGVKQHRMRDSYLVLRFVAFYLLRTDQLKQPAIEYRSDIDALLASVMKFINTKATDQLIEQVKQSCLCGMDNVYQLLGDQAFRFAPKEGGNRRPVNMGLFEMLVFAFCSLDPRQFSSQLSMQLVNDYKAKLEAEGLFSGVIDTTGAVNARFERAEEIIEGVKHAQAT
jgi:hypothetical protein